MLGFVFGSQCCLFIGSPLNGPQSTDSATNPQSTISVGWGFAFGVSGGSGCLLRSATLLRWSGSLLFRDRNWRWLRWSRGWRRILRCRGERRGDSFRPASGDQCGSSHSIHRMRRKFLNRLRTRRNWRRSRLRWWLSNRRRNVLSSVRRSLGGLKHAILVCSQRNLHCRDDMVPHAHAGYH